MAIEGFTVWFHDRGVVRQITVAEADEAKVAQTIRDKFPGCDLLSQTRLDGRVIKFLQMSPGETKEWFSGDRTPLDPKFGSEKLS